MKIVIPGGSGQVGTILARAFHAEGQEVRGPEPHAGRACPLANRAVGR